MYWNRGICYWLENSLKLIRWSNKSINFNLLCSFILNENKIHLDKVNIKNFCNSIFAITATWIIFLFVFEDVLNFCFNEKYDFEIMKCPIVNVKQQFELGRCNFLSLIKQISTSKFFVLKVIIWIYNFKVLLLWRCSCFWNSITNWRRE